MIETHKLATLINDRNKHALLNAQKHIHFHCDDKESSQ